jgi:hypothetical protein
MGVATKETALFPALLLPLAAAGPWRARFRTAGQPWAAVGAWAGVRTAALSGVGGYLGRKVWLPWEPG